MKSLSEFREMKKAISDRLLSERQDGKPRIIIGMGTCGIAAGAREILRAVQSQVESRKLDLAISQTGCIGMCQYEPLMDVEMPNGQRITYGGVTAADIPRIISEHVLNGTVVEELAIASYGEGVGNVPSYSELGFFQKQHRLALANCGRIDPKYRRIHCQRRLRSLRQDFDR